MFFSDIVAETHTGIANEHAWASNEADRFILIFAAE
jgi:hypothetical protein